MGNPKCASIEVKFEDGSRSFTTTPEQAEAIWRWIMGAEAVHCIHGAAFTGKPFDRAEAVRDDG